MSVQSHSPWGHMDLHRGRDRRPTVSGTARTYSVREPHRPTVSGTARTHSVGNRTDPQCQGAHGPTVSGSHTDPQCQGATRTHSVREPHRPTVSGTARPAVSGTTWTYSVREPHSVRDRTDLQCQGHRDLQCQGLFIHLLPLLSSISSPNLDVDLLTWVSVCPLPPSFLSSLFFLIMFTLHIYLHISRH